MKATKLYKFFLNLFESDLESRMNTDLDAGEYDEETGFSDNRYRVAKDSATNVAAKNGKAAEYFEDRFIEEEDLIDSIADDVRYYYRED